jgi:WD40 repeat protein
LAVAGSRRRLLSSADGHQVRPLEDALPRREDVQRLAFVANGTLLVEMPRKEPLGFWRVDGAFLYSLDFPMPPQRARWQQVALSQTSHLGLSDGNTVAVWDAERAAVERWIAPSQGAVGALALSEDAGLLAMVEGEARPADASVVFTSARISLWDAQQGRRLRTISLASESVTALAIAPDKATLAATVLNPQCPLACDTTINFYRTSDGQWLGRSAAWTGGPDPDPPTRLSYVPGGSQIAAASLGPDGVAQLAIIRNSDGALLNLMAFSGDPVFTPDGRLVSADLDIEIRSAIDGTIFQVIAASTGNQAPTFSPDGQLLASVDGDDVILWHVGDGTVSTRFAGLGKNVSLMAFSPDGRILASGGKDGLVRLWTVDQSHEPLLQKQGQPVTSLAFSPDGATVVTGDRNGSIYVRKTQTGATENVWYGHSAISALAFSPDGTLVASGGQGPGLRLWERQSGQTVTSAAHGAGVTALSFVPDGSRLVTAAAKASCPKPCPQDEGDPDLKIWNVVGPSLELASTIPLIPQDAPERFDPRLPAHAAVWGLGFAPDGRTLFTAGPQNAGHVYRFPEGIPLGGFDSFFAGSPFAVSHDATRIVTGSSPIQQWCAAASGP